MNNNHRELTGREKQQVRKLVTSHCANYDKEYDCLPLDCDCPMLHICYTTSAMCRYFRKSVLADAPELEAVFNRTATVNCKQCGKSFPIDGKGCTAPSSVQRKLAASRLLHEYESTVKRKVQCNRFALDKPCAARLF